MSGSERPGASRVVAMLQAALGLVLVFVLHVLVGAALLGGAMTSGVDALYRATVWWGGCLGVSQL
ncbi:MAG: hypothetical protein H6735_33935, partial [Alphaproteobacteria bacterium]|nr:hypothetical protein [Alphaproteobacteria bacterium]